MFVVRRKRNEGIVIDAEVTITIREVEGGQVVLAIDAPDDILIRRQELLTQWEGPPASPPR